MRGCWIERLPDGGARLMRWFPDGENWRGEAQFTKPDGDERSISLRLEPQGEGWRICALYWDEPAKSSCAPAIFGSPPSPPSGPWSQIDASRDRLKMIARPSGRVIIDAARDGCD